MKTVDYKIKKAGWLGKNIKSVDDLYLDKMAANWAPLQISFIYDAESNEYKSIADISKYKEIALRSYKRNVLTCLVIYAVVFLILVILTSNFGFSQGLRLSIFFAILIFLCAYEMILFGSRPNEIINRSYYYNAIFSSNPIRLTIIAFMALMTVAGLLQTIAIHLMGSSEVVERFGFIYSDFANGQFWRLISGALLHGNFLHWFSNVVFGVVLIGFSKSHLKVPWIFLIAVGSCTSFIVSYIMNRSMSSGVIGMSGGLLFLAGVLVVSRGSTHHLCVPMRLPRAIRFQLAAIAAITILVSPQLFDNAANTVHASALSLGALIGLSLRFFYKNH